LGENLNDDEIQEVRVCFLWICHLVLGFSFLPIIGKIFCVHEMLACPVLYVMRCCVVNVELSSEPFLKHKLSFGTLWLAIGLVQMIDEADRDNDGQINPQEFLRVMKKRGDNPLDDWDSDED
jgi:hypothetical protein